MFQSARLKLTFWYVLISIIISLVFSVVLFLFLHRELGRSVRRLELRQEILQDLAPPDVPRLKVNQQVIEGAENRIKLQLIYVNMIVLAVSALAGYFLAGRTLKPIKQMVDEQNRFVADASHELRTPLTGLKTAIEVNLRDKKLNLQQAKSILKENLADVDRIKKLSDNLLALVKLQRFSSQEKKTKVSLKNILVEALNRSIYLAKTKKIIIKSSLEEVTIYGDVERLTDLFVIFLDNAIKYSQDKKEVFLDLKSTDHYGEVKIKDQGTGIEKDELSHIFDRFYRVDKSRTHNKTEGYGLGLAIAKEIIRNHKGTVAVESDLGKGTIFTIRLPRVK